MTHKLTLPMAIGRDYVVPLLEQQDLARRYGMELGAVKASLGVLKDRMLAGQVDPQRSATKTKRLISAHFDSSNATGRQGA